MKLPFMSMYWSDYLQDTKALDWEEHGLYCNLIAAYWHQQKGFTLEEACQELKEKRKKYCKKIEKILEKFFKKQGETYIHNRIELELAKAMGKSDSAKKAASERWAKPDANALQTHMRIACLPEPEPQPEPEVSKDTTSSSVSPSGEDQDQAEVFVFPNGTARAGQPSAYPPRPTPQPQTEEAARQSLRFEGQMFTLIRETGETLREDEWLYEHLQDSVDRKKLLDHTPTLAALIYQSHKTRRTVHEWLTRPIAERMAACALVEAKPGLDNGVLYGIKAMDGRWEPFTKWLKPMLRAVEANDLLINFGGSAASG